MTKQAERPCLIDFRSGAFDDEDLATLQLNANDVVEWETGECIPELGASIFQVLFKGYPITEEGTLTMLGSVCYDACDYGLDIYRIIGDALYEARHPWLDWRDFKNKSLQDTIQVHLLDDKGQEWEAEWWYSNDDTYELDLDRRYLQINGYSYSPHIVAVKPKRKEDWYMFNQVKVWQPPESVL